MNKHKKLNPTEKRQECHTFSLKTLCFILQIHLFRALVLTHFGCFPSIFSKINPCGPDGNYCILNSNTVIADGMFLIQSTPRCLNYSLFVQKIVSSVLKLSQHRADLFFDVYESPSIKDTKRKERRNE